MLSFHNIAPMHISTQSYPPHLHHSGDSSPIVVDDVAGHELQLPMPSESGTEEGKVERGDEEKKELGEEEKVEKGDDGRKEMSKEERLNETSLSHGAEPSEIKVIRKQVYVYNYVKSFCDNTFLCYK